jgi:hypothetical protein
MALIDPPTTSTQEPGGATVEAPCEFDPCEPNPDPAPPPGAVYERKLDIRARHQYRWFYCGPAVVQVLSNLQWGKFVTNTTGAGGQSTTANKYTQTYIDSTWTNTTTAGTDIGDLIRGINQASGMSRFYSQFDADPSTAGAQDPTWAQFHNAVVVDVWNWDAGAAAGVNPKKTGSAYYLTSWKSVPAGDYGHYIALTGYTNPDNTTSSKIWYADSSGGKDQVNDTVILGSTGNFSDSSKTVYQTMMNRYGNLVN